MRRNRSALKNGLSIGLPPALLIAGLLAGQAISQDPDPRAPMPDMAEMMRMQMEMMRDAVPGPEHEELAKRAGVFDLASTMSMPVMPGMPAMEPMEAKGECESEMVLGGRFLMSRASGQMMGMDTEQIYFLGFDRRHDKYVTVGLDTMGTYFVTAEGVRDEDGIIRMHGHDDDGMGGQDYSFELDDRDPDRIVTSVYFSRMGPMEFDPPHELVEIVQTRRKDG